MPEVQQDARGTEQLNKNETRQKIRHAVDEDGKNGINCHLENGNERAGTADLMCWNGTERSSLHQRAKESTRDVMKQDGN